MRNIKDMGIILIDITNACNMMCSNCTRFCGHFRKDKLYYMTPEYFEKAATTLKEYSELGDDKLVGVMGGEPTLHPQFVEICEIFKKCIPDKNKRGLWSNTLTPQYKKHINVINDTFGKFNLNNHTSHPIKHAPILVASEDFKDVTKENMDKIIEECWVQKYWSATITPKGAYFCEVCACMSTLFDGISGWDIEKEPNWWKKELPTYKEQINWACHKCGCAIPLQPRRSTDETDDVSVSNLKRLQDVSSPKIAKGKYQLVDCSKNKIDTTQVRNCAWYWNG